MAGKCRIKVSVENVQPFWMFVDIQECPRIVDVEQKIQQRCTDVILENLWLDGCVLPSNEPSELLRDNDVVHVEAKQCIHKPVESDVTRTPKLVRKRKWAEVDKDQPESEGELQEKHRAKKGIKDSSCIETKNKKKSKKQKKIKERGKAEPAAEEDDSLCVTRATHHPVTSEADQQNIPKQKKKQKEKKITQKRSTEKEFIVTVEPTCLSEQSVSASSSKAHEKNGIKDNSEVANAAEEPMLTNSITAADVNGSAGTNKKRRRRKRKKAFQESLSNASTLNSRDPATGTNVAPAPLRLPKGHQPQSKKVVFSSDEDSITVGDEAHAKNAEEDDNNDKPCENAQISSYSNSFSESFPAVSMPFSSQTRADEDGSSDAVNGGLATGRGEVNSIVEVNGDVGMGSYVAQSNSSDTMGMENEWYRNQQYQDKLAEEKSLKHKKASALEKSVTPVHLYTDSQRQVVQPNLAEYLKMSPQDRGVKLSPYVKAKRLSNGAMLYTRNPVAAIYEQMDHTKFHDTSSPFSHPAVHNSLQASPRELGKQQQLDTINTNKSIIIQNPSRTEEGVSKGEVKLDSRDVAEAGHDPSRQSCAMTTDKDQVVITITPLFRDYSLFPDLTAPKVGDQIAYKVLELGDDYTPGMSDYKEAEVLEYDASSESVTVRLLNNDMALGKKKPGRFDLPGEERNEEGTVVTLELMSMFERKLMSSS